jgi:HK97 family phage portal protein
MRIPVLSRVLSRLTAKTDGQQVPGPWYLPITGGWLSEEVGSHWDWWQRGGMPIPQTAQSAIVEACVSAYAQTLAMCPMNHWRATGKGGRERVTNSAASRLMRCPNDYQTISDFMMNMVRYMYLTGNSYALGVRNQRFEIDQLHMMHPGMSWPQMATTGDVFYRLGGNHVINYRVGEEPIIVPARDVLHFRLQVNQARWPFPLTGQSPLMSAMADLAVQSSMMDQQTGFYRNAARPSAVLQTDLMLDKDQVTALRDRWNEQTKQLQAGGTPILTAGLKVQPWSVSGQDAQLAEMMKMTEDHIALAFRVPMQILGLARGGTSYRSTEVLMQSWIATGLGFCLWHVEQSLNLMFGLKGKPDEYIEADTSVLLRSAQKDRLEALARGVQGGIYSPNEARGLEDLDSVGKWGDEPRVQQQIVPLSAAEGIPAAPGPGAAPGAPPAPKPTEAKPDEPPKQQKSRNHDVQREFRNILNGAARYERERFGS